MGISIKENKEEIKSFEKNPIFEEEFEIVPKGKTIFPPKDLILKVIILFLVATASFGFGRMIRLEEKTPVVIRGNGENLSPVNTNFSQNEFGKGLTSEVKGVTNSNSDVVVASKSGTKYHFPWCAGAKRILDENKIFFDSSEEARKAGYTPAANCKGLK